MTIVKEVWEALVERGPMVRFANKLKSLKKRVQVWNKETFGKVEQRVMQVEENLLEIEFAFEQNPSETNKI